MKATIIHSGYLACRDDLDIYHTLEGSVVQATGYKVLYPILKEFYQGENDHLKKLTPTDLRGFFHGKRVHKMSLFQPLLKHLKKQKIQIVIDGNSENVYNLVIGRLGDSENSNVQSLEEAIIQFIKEIEKQILIHSEIKNDIPIIDVVPENLNSIPNILNGILADELLHIYEAAIVSHRSGGAPHINNGKTIPITQHSNKHEQTNWLFTFLSSRSSAKLPKYISEKENLHNFLHKQGKLNDFWLEKIEANMNKYLNNSSKMAADETKKRIKIFIQSKEN
ncbi:hypothetical protein OAN96_01155 [Candidatus Gracilibacteria bacterium]|nr:hypothetical protein [Candidatus Gracilibacteria bacterium]